MCVTTFVVFAFLASGVAHRQLSASRYDFKSCIHLGELTASYLIAMLLKKLLRDYEVVGRTTN